MLKTRARVEHVHNCCYNTPESEALAHLSSQHTQHKTQKSQPSNRHPIRARERRPPPSLPQHLGTPWRRQSPRCRSRRPCRCRPSSRASPVSSKKKWGCASHSARRRFFTAARRSRSRAGVVAVDQCTTFPPVAACIAHLALGGAEASFARKPSRTNRLATASLLPACVLLSERDKTARQTASFIARLRSQPASIA